MFGLLDSQSALQSLCDAGAPEGLRLEFKTKEDPLSPELSTGDKRAIAKTVSSFANSDGGTLIYGIRSANRSGSDVALELLPIECIDQFLVNVNLVCALNIVPELPSIKNWVVYDEDRRGAGYVVLEVGRSDRRPHMSAAPGHHSYFRRSFSGASLMTPSEIRDQILAVRDAVIEPTIIMASGGAPRDLGVGIGIRSSFLFGLINVGSCVCKNPFLRVRSNRKTRSHEATFSDRMTAWKIELPSGAMIHVDDQIHLFSLEFCALARVLTSDLMHWSEGDLISAVEIHESTGTSHLDTLPTAAEIPDIRLDAIFGAENSPVRSKYYTLDRDLIASQLLLRSGNLLKNIALQKTGIWRDDLIQSISDRVDFDIEGTDSFDRN